MQFTQVSYNGFAKYLRKDHWTAHQLCQISPTGPTRLRSAVAGKAPHQTLWHNQSVSRY